MLNVKFIYKYSHSYFGICGKKINNFKNDISLFNYIEKYNTIKELYEPIIVDFEIL